MEMVEDLVADKACSRLFRDRQQGDFRPTQRTEDCRPVALGSCADCRDCLVRRSLYFGAGRVWATVHADPSDHAHYHDADLDRGLGSARGHHGAGVWLRRLGSELNVSLLFGATYFIVGTFGGLVWIFSAEKAAHGAAPIEVPE